MKHTGKGFYRLFLSGILFLILLAGCGDGNGGGENSEATTTTIIGTDGGIATSNDGTLNIEIPSGAITEDVVISITKISLAEIGVDESIVLSEPYRLKIEPKSLTALGTAAISAETLLDIGKGIVKVTFKNVQSVTNTLVAKVGGIGEISAVFTTALLTMAENATDLRVGIPIIELPIYDIDLFVYDPTLLREYIEPPSLNPFTKQRQADNSSLGAKTPIILIHGINREENLENTCTISTPWCYKPKKEVWDTFYSLASNAFFDRFKVYEYIYPTFKSARWSGRQLATIIKNDPELQGTPLYIIAHSMGGLVARYAMSFGESGQVGSGIGDNVNEVYTIATPHHGSIGASLLYLDQGKLYQNYNSVGFDSNDYIAFATATGAARGYYGSAAYTEGYLSLLWDNYDDGLTNEWMDIGAIDNGELKLFNQIDPYKDKITAYAGGNILSDSLYDNQMAIQAATVMATLGIYNADNSPPNYFDSDAMVPRSSALFATNNTAPYLSEVDFGLNNKGYKDKLDHQDVFKDEEILNDIIGEISGAVPIDTTPPSIPSNLNATAVSSTQIDLSWTASTDDTGVSGYKIYKDGAYLKSIGTTSTSDTGLTPSTQYCYSASAYDGSGNESGQSGSACAMTLSVPNTNPLIITTTSLQSVTIGVSYGTNLSATGGRTPYSWSTTNGNLPPGLSLGTGGLISGTPTTAGTYSFTVQATDSSFPQQTASKVLSITVTVNLPGNTSPTATITSPSGNYNQGDPINFSGSGFDAEDGILTGSSLVWTSNIDGQISTGTSFTRSNLSVGIHNITLIATDSNGATGGDSTAIIISQPNGMITVGPTSLNFGNIQVGTCNTSQFAIQHVIGTAPALGTVSVSPNPPFNITSGSPFTASNGAGPLVDVQFCPVSAGTVSGTATVSSSATFTGAHTVTLTGIGFNPAPTTGTIQVNATLNGASWSGSVNYTLTGPNTFSGTSVPANFSNRPQGGWSISYTSGGPTGAAPSSITPSISQTLTGGGSITFTLNFTSSNPIEHITNGSFTSGTSGWTLVGDFWAGTNLTRYRTSPGYAAGGVDSSGNPKDNAIGYMYQTVTIPSNATSATISFWYNITSQETGATAFDVLNATIQNSTGGYLATVAVLSNLNKGTLGVYSQKSLDVTLYKGQTIRVNFLATTNGSNTTVFRIDDVSLMSDG